MVKILIISSRAGAGIAQAVVEFPHSTHAETAIKQIELADSLRLNDLGTKIQAVRLYDPQLKNFEPREKFLDK
jgi:hypothetical protein